METVFIGHYCCECSTAIFTAGLSKNPVSLFNKTLSLLSYNLFFLIFKFVSFCRFKLSYLKLVLSGTVYTLLSSATRRKRWVCSVCPGPAFAKNKETNKETKKQRNKQTSKQTKNKQTNKLTNKKEKKNNNSNKTAESQVGHKVGHCMGYGGCSR